jgi:hypothetical protein
VQLQWVSQQAWSSRRGGMRSSQSPHCSSRGGQWWSNSTPRAVEQMHAWLHWKHAISWQLYTADGAQFG